jgi:2-haloacid dehalogenase
MATVSRFRPRYVTFDCYGTLVDFRMSDVAEEVVGARLNEELVQDFLQAFAAYRLDEVMGDWKPYRDVVADALRRAMRRYGLSYRDADAERIYEAVPTWGPHPEVPAVLAALARRYPLVILSNAAEEQIPHTVAKLGAPFHAVYTAEQAGAYKPRLGAFEYLLDRLGCGPDDIVHVSSSLRYDLMPANDLGITGKVYVNRGYEPAAPSYGYREIRDLSGLPGLFA